jgi:hypothetical protein
VRAALRQMSQARHVGKIVVRSRTLQQQQGEEKVCVSADVLHHLCSQAFIVMLLTSGGIKALQEPA